ncbi:histidine kinase [Kouleothrix sp.]|uniref:GAF domain-containing sensor histidine kinase n=1 Tax=Kouleothrix sp. TaxID=2779161 RepID=UPI0039194366
MYARHQAAIVELTQAVLSNSPPPVLMHQAAQLVAQTLAVPFSSIWEASSDRGSLVLRAGFGWPDADAGLTTALEPATPSGAAARGTSPAIVLDWASRPPGQPAPAQPGIVSSAYVAIPGPGAPFGSLGVDVTASRRFGEEELDFLRASANVLALANEQARLAQGLEQRVEEHTRAIEQQQLAAAQEQAVLEERQRLARDLHDSVTQALYSVTLHAQGARRLLALGEAASVAEALRALQDTAQEALDEMRLLIFDLRPPVLEQVGLVAAVQARLNAVEGRATLSTRLLADELGALPAAAEQALYRICQEALNNALKHARAHTITVRIQQAAGRIVLEVADDGVGFVPGGVGESGGLGLRGIAERVAQLGGTMALQSAPGTGTTLHVEIGV